MALTTVDEVKNMLRWGTAEATKYEGQLDAYIAAASKRVEEDAGPFEARTVVHVCDGGDTILLPHAPNEVTLVQVTGDGGGEWVDGYFVPVDGWVTFDGTYKVNHTAGILYGPFPYGRQNVKVTFTVGMDTIPDDVQLAATMVAVDMWAIASQRAPSLDDQVDPSYLMPKVVRDLLAPYKRAQMPGFA